MLDVWLDSVVLLQTGPSLCAGVVVAGDAAPPAQADDVDAAAVRTVATAYHCVASGLAPLVKFRGGDARVGRVVARDPAHDLALIEVVVPVEVAGLPLRAEPAVIGDTVYALGHPFGQATGGKLSNLLVWSAARGMVSGVGPWLIQTDTAMNPGNSGGPLVDEQGRVVGIVSRKIQSEGIGFAAKADRLAEMKADPDMGPFLGGTWGVGVGFLQGDRAEVGGNVTFVFRERLVTRAWLGVGLGDAAGFGIVTMEARQRLGRGPLSTTLDVGGGVKYLEKGVTPLISGRVSIASVGFGAHLVPGTWETTFTLDVEWPGVLGVF
ncbi:MAG: serine protease [Pseudomonadota bacterium]|nr:serine protease [Pseudomonadota bacterium]